jgi:predicted RND superfamily exporter protein
MSIVINMGTNIIFGEISSITQCAAAILQLAVSMDYAIFLLHRFASLRRDGQNVEEAMQGSIRDSATTIIASALTTILGFLALVIMRFGIGADLGIVLAKGIVLSLISVLTLLPILAVYTYKIIDKTYHRSLIPSSQIVGKGIVKCRYAILIIVLLLIIPSFIASQNNTFSYGSSGINSEDSKVYKDTEAINKKFGVDNQMAILVPKGDYSKEIELIADIKSLIHVKSINAFATTFGINIPIEYLPQDIVAQFISAKYSRIIIKTDVAEEGKDTFRLVEKIREIAHKHYKDSYHLAGISVTNYDMKQTITKDNLIVNVLAIVSILAVLIIMFKSLIIPLILVITIETAIWINLSIAYLTGGTLNYIGYLIISTVQLGATVDYAILFAKKYLGRDNTMSKKQAVIETIEETAPSILSSASILAIAGFGLGFISTNGVISQLGILVGRGALISALMVLIFVSTMFIFGHKFISKKADDIAPEN